MYDKIKKVDDKVKDKYLYNLQKLLDLLDNVEDKKLKKIVIYQMLEYNKSLIDLIENYENGNTTKK